jgi:hypothetical protein
MKNKKRTSRILLVIGLTMLVLSLVGFFVVYKRTPQRNTLILDVSRENKTIVQPTNFPSDKYLSTPQPTEQNQTPAPPLSSNIFFEDGMVKETTQVLMNRILIQDFESTSGLIVNPITGHISDSLIITFAVTNTGSSPITITTVADRLVGTLVRVDGANGDDQISAGESWLYTASHTLQASNILTSTVVIIGTDHQGESLAISMDYFVYLGKSRVYVVPLTVGSRTFPDISTSSSFQEYVEYIFNASIIEGCSEGSFRPENNLTRGEVTELFARALLEYASAESIEIEWPKSILEAFLEYKPTEIIEAEWPKSIEVDQSDSVRVSFIQTKDGGYVARLESEDNVIIPATPLPVGTPSAPLVDAFGPEYEGFARADLGSGAFNIVSVWSEEYSLAQKEITWKWNVISNKPGRQVLDAIVEVVWRPKDGGDPIKRISWQQSLQILVKKPLIGTDQLLLFSVMGLLTGTGFSTSWFYWKLKQRRRLQEYSRRIDWVLATDFDLDDLRVALTDYFDLEELRTLCFKLQVDYDHLRGEGKGGKARELVAHMARRKRIDDLVMALRKARPGLFDDKWDYDA